VIGGADGFEPSALPNGAIRWRFGVQTWPHKLVRVMIAEQVYRALSILSGSPYHRD
jgi:23S rRNA (pseudouridine1915-N3)-methyltransferase